MFPTAEVDHVGAHYDDVAALRDVGLQRGDGRSKNHYLKQGEY